MPEPRVELFLASHAETAWSAAIRPWLERGHGRLERAHVVVATRGQAQGLKQRCVGEGVALLGVEFLTPGLARKKWTKLRGGQPAGVLGRELLLFELRAAIALRLRGLAPEDAQRGVWMSLQSDAERALDDFDALLKAGFGAEHFAHAPLREVFGEVAARVRALGYEFGPSQNELAALQPVGEGDAMIGGRVLVYGLTAEAWGEFFNVAAFVRRFRDITVVLPEPVFRGRSELDEQWVELWRTLLGAAPLPLDAPPPSQSCEYVAAGWAGEPAPAAGAGGAGEAVRGVAPVRILVGKTRADEMGLVATEVGRLLAAGAESIAVVFPSGDAARARLAELLAARGIAFVDLLESAGAPPAEARLQRALLEFYARGGRLEELLALWPLLRAEGLVSVSTGEAREVCERLFDERQSHALAAYAEVLAAGKRPAWQELGRVAGLLLPVWPEEISLGEALARFRGVCAALSEGLPVAWPALEAFAERETRVLPTGEVIAALASFLPQKSPVAKAAGGAGGAGGFARVTFTTRRRAEGLAWSQVIFVESNANVWPVRRGPGGWLSDEYRAELNREARYSLGLFTAEDAAWLEKRGYAALARDTSGGVVFSAALGDEAEPEAVLAPNAWLERVLWRETVDRPEGHDLQGEFERRAVAGVEVSTAGGAEGVELAGWSEVWRRRRDPAAEFDGHFFSVDPARVRPASLAARLVERGVRDPAALWFEAVLGLKPVGWQPLERVRRRSLGQLVHRMLAAALQPEGARGTIGPKPDAAEAWRRLRAELGRVRGLWPQDVYWDSFHAELAQVCEVLLENVLALETGGFVATECNLPAGATVPLGAAGGAGGAGVLAVTGRIDVAFFDRPGWAGATVDVVDFKTGADKLPTQERMARSGEALQLGVYLAAARSVGAVAGRVWMNKPEPGACVALELGNLDEALVRLEQVGQHLETGRYGALTPDRSEYTTGGARWPLACVPVAEAVLRAKFAATFGVGAGDEEEGGDE